jgi:hypothetical protein
VINLFLQYPWLASTVFAVIATIQAIGFRMTGAAWLTRGQSRTTALTETVNECRRHVHGQTGHLSMMR